MRRNFDKSLVSWYDTAPDQNESSKQEILEFEASTDSINTSLGKKKLEVLNKVEFERDVTLTIYYQIKCDPLR